ncbi:MAG: TetR/AcrR family transcriptional regulator [Bryobacteraceae bacterium]
MKQEKPRTKHELRSEATRAALLKAAESIFARDGYENAQIDQIAEQSGRTRGAVYAQFKTKEQLFFALHEQLFEESARDFAKFSAELEQTEHRGRLEALRQYYSDVDNPWGTILDLEMKLYAVRHPESAGEWRERYLRFYTHPSFAKEFGVARPPGTSLIQNRALALTALKGGVLLTHLFLPDQVTKKEARLLLEEIFDALFPKGADADQTRKHTADAHRGKRKTSVSRQAKAL